MNEVLFEDQTLRDGLQNENRVFSLEEKEELLHTLIDSGLKRFQLGSFVHPKRVPQMANTDDLIHKVGPKPGITLTGLILNEKGLERAFDCGITHVAISVSASDAHSRKNVNRSSKEALDSMAPLVEKAVHAGLTVRAGIQCAFGCVYEGYVDHSVVLSAAKTLATAGAKEINLADTTGMGSPRTVRQLCDQVQKALPDCDIILHLHNTRGLGLANMLAGYENGVRIFDVCAGGLGGCPFVRGAAGNIPTEDAAYLFESMNIPTGVDISSLISAVEALEQKLDRTLPGHMKQIIHSQQPLC